MLLHFDPTHTILIALIFIWTGFVRSGLGFGGGALGLPLMLLIDDQPLLWLPIIGFHLLFFSGLTLGSRLANVDWRFLLRSFYYILPAALAGVFGLLNLPNRWLLVFIYGVTLFYALIWVFDLAIESRGKWVDRLLLMVGGYVAGTSLTGAPLMVAVFMRNVAKAQLRNTLFVLWFTLVVIKMTTLAALGVELHLYEALLLLPVAAIGHVIGLRTHEAIIRNDRLFRQWIGGGLLIVSALGLWSVLAT